LGGISSGSTIIPPEMLMTMMNDLAQRSVAEGVSSFIATEARPSTGFNGTAGAPIGVEGFMMFVDQQPLMGGSS
jgi:hypothetical protein